MLLKISRHHQTVQMMLVSMLDAGLDAVDLHALGLDAGLDAL